MAKVEKPKITDLRSALEKYVSANMATRLEGLAEALQWYDKALIYVIAEKKVDQKVLDSKIGLANKTRALGVSSTFPEEKDSSFTKSIRYYQQICSYLNPVMDAKTGRRNVDIDTYIDKYNELKAELEEAEKRAQAKYQPVLDFLNTVFGNLGFKISIDPNASKDRAYSGPDTNEITYSRKAAKEVYDTLRLEGLLVAMKKELMLFSRAKAMAKDSNDQWIIRYDIQVKTID